MLTIHSACPKASGATRGLFAFLTGLLLVGLTTSEVAHAQPHQGRDPELAEQLALLTRIAQEKSALAVKFEHGDGLPRDPVMAAQLYCEAARDGHPDAQFRLGWMYANGRGVSRDDGIAASFFRLASEQQHPQAMALSEVVKGSPDAPASLPPCMSQPRMVEISGHQQAKAPSTVALQRNQQQMLSMRADAFMQQLAQSAPRRKVVQWVEQLAPRYQLDPRLVLAVIQAESNFDVSAKSPKNAQGLMQLIPATAERFGINNPQDPAQNLRGGMAYLRWLLAFFRGDVALALAGYNAGEGAVERYRGIPPYAETIAYVQRIRTLYPIPTHPFDPTAANSVSQTAGRNLTARVHWSQ